MYKDVEIGLDTYKKYYELVSLLKQKGTTSSKLTKLEMLLDYFIENYDNLNNEEIKLIKNVIMIANGIITKVNTYYGIAKQRQSSCIERVEILKEKEKKLIK